MAIIKNRSKVEFAQIPNEALADKRLSLRATGLLSYLLSLPYDWDVYTSEIVTHHTDGIKSLNSALKELIKFGYIERVKTRGEKGHYSGYEYSVFNTPTRLP